MADCDSDESPEGYDSACCGLADLFNEDGSLNDGASNNSRITFSFDSSGWLYVYHLGVGHFLQQRLLHGCSKESRASRFAFSGSSGGALVAAALCADVDIAELASFVIDCRDECRFNPWRMFACAEQALDRFLPCDAHLNSQGRLRVLLTRVKLSFPQPIVWPGKSLSHTTHTEIRPWYSLCVTPHFPPPFSPMYHHLLFSSVHHRDPKPLPFSE